MARAITKSFSNSKTTVIVRVLTENGLEEKQVVLDGNKSERAARIQCEKILGTPNFMVVSREVCEDEQNSATYSMSAELFVANADICEPDKSYGHDTVTATMKITEVAYYTLDSSEPKKYYFSGVTTERKLRNAICEYEKTQNVIMLNPTVSDIRYWMSKDKFIELADKREN